MPHLLNNYGRYGLEGNFYHRTISTYSAVIGTLVDQIQVSRQNGKFIKVPLIYAGQQKANNRLDQNPDPEGARKGITLPVIAFSFDGMEYDSSRQKNTSYLQTNIHGDKLGAGAMDSFGNQVPDDVDTMEIRYQQTRIPFKFYYTIAARTKFFDDLLQIMEQINVTLGPGLQVTVLDNPDLDDRSAVMINLNESTYHNKYEGTYTETQEFTNEWHLTLEGYLYNITMPNEYGTNGQYNNPRLIRSITVNYHDLMKPEGLIDQTYTDENNVNTNEEYWSKRPNDLRKG